MPGDGKPLFSKILDQRPCGALRGIPGERLFQVTVAQNIGVGHCREKDFQGRRPLDTGQTGLEDVGPDLAGMFVLICMSLTSCQAGSSSLNLRRGSMRTTLAHIWNPAPPLCFSQLSSTLALWVVGRVALGTYCTLVPSSVICGS